MPGGRLDRDGGRVTRQDPGMGLSLDIMMLQNLFCRSGGCVAVVIFSEGSHANFRASI